MGPIFSPGFSPHIRVPARFFPMAEHKTSSPLLGTNPLHPGLSNGLEGAMRLAVYPLQLERSPSLFLSFPFHTLIFLSEAESFGLFQTFTFSLYFSLLFTATSVIASLFFPFKLNQPHCFNWGVQCGINRCAGEFTGNKHDSSIEVHLQLFLCAHVENVTYCQSHRSWLGTLETAQTSLVTLLLQHLYSVTQKPHTCRRFHFSAFRPASNVFRVGVMTAGAPNKDTSS